MKKLVKIAIAHSDTCVIDDDSLLKQIVPATVTVKYSDNESVRNIRGAYALGSSSKDSKCVIDDVLQGFSSLAFEQVLSESSIAICCAIDESESSLSYATQAYGEQPNLFSQMTISEIEARVVDLANITRWSYEEIISKNQKHVSPIQCAELWALEAWDWEL